MLSTKDYATTTWNSFRRAIASRPGRMIGTAALLLALTLTTLVYSAPAQAQTPSADATLSALGVSPKDIIGFDGARRSYEVGVASTVEQATVTATANDSGASVAYSGTDADASTNGYQVDLSAGRNVVTVTVTAEDGATTLDYTVSVNLGVADAYGWKAVDDLDGLIAADNNSPYGIWSDGTTMWVADGTDGKIYAYNTDGTRDSDKDFDTLAAEGNTNPISIWSDGTTMWVADNGDDKIYAYNTDGTLDNTKEFNTLDAAGNIAPRGIWSDGTTMWVADNGDDKIYAYRMSDQARDSVKDFNTLTAAGNTTPFGIWSDDTTMWVADFDDDKLYAYRMSDQARDSVKDFNTLTAAGNNTPFGIWSDGTTMWVLDNTDDKVYSYNMPPSDDATLSGLTVSPRDIIGFTADRSDYDVGVASTVSQATITATARNPGARVAYSGTDADLTTEGHQVNLSAGRNVVTVTVTASDTTTAKTYTVSVNRGVTDAKGWQAGADLDRLIAVGNGAPQGIWSDGTTLWVADFDRKLYAYNLSDGTRDADRDITLGGQNNVPRGIWSDGTTLWVADFDDAKIYAYQLSAGTRDAGQDINTLVAASNQLPVGIWSDGTTLWVVDAADAKLYAYNMPRSSTDATLSALGVAPRDIIGFDGARTSYEVGVDSTVATATVSATANHAGASVAFDPADADANATGHQVDLSAGRNVVTVRVTAADGATTLDYTVSVNQGVTDAKGWQAGADLDGLIAAGNVAPQGIWSDGTTAWVADSIDAKLYAYRLSGGTRDAGRDITLATIDGVAAPQGIWSDGTTLWGADNGTAKVYAYQLSGGTRDAGRDITLARIAGNDDPRGIWSDGTTLWVADWPDAKLYAYRLSGGTRDAGRDITLADGNDDPAGIWSDGTTLWVADWFDDKVYAYRLSGGTRDAGRDFDTLAAAGNTSPVGIWSDGTTLWVADWFDDKVYAYNMPRSDTPTVCVEATTAPDFSADRNTLGTVDIGRSVCSQIEPAYDIDWFAVDLVEGSTYVIDLEGRATNAGTLFDPILSSVHITRAGTGRGVAQVMGSPRSIRDDNDGEGNDSRLMFTVVEPGRYYIATRGFASHTGTYVLSVNRRTLDSLRPIVYPNGPTGRPLILLRAAPAPDPGPLGPDMPDSTTTTATVIVNGVNNDDPDDDGRYHGQIDTPNDRDWIRVWLKSKKAYVIHMLGAGNAWSEDENSWRLTLRGPQIGGVFRTDREPGDPHPYGLPGTGGTPTNDRWAAGPQSAAYFTATETGWHYIQAQAQSAVQTGTYAAHVFDLSNPWGAPAPAPPTFALSTAGPGEPPGQPQGLTGTVAHDVVSLTWDDPDDASITGYQILRLDRDVHGVGNFQVHVDDTGSAAATYVDWNVEPETRYVYRIKARSAVGLSKRSGYFNANTPAAPDPAPNNPATGAPTIKGTAEVGKTLTADTSGIEDADGLSDAVFSYQWIISLGAGSADIPGATDATYTPAASDEGVAIRVRVSFTDDADNDESLTSAATAAVEARPNSPATGVPTIRGAVQVGKTLTADTSGIEDADGLANVSYSYQWIANDGASETDLTGNTNSTYTLIAADEGKTIKVRVSFTDDASNGEWLTSAATEEVSFAVQQQNSNSPATGVPTISGVSRVGETLTADTSGIEDQDGLTNATFGYQWLADDSEIPGATASTYTLADTDEGKTIQVKVSFTDDAGNPEMVASQPTETVSPDTTNTPATGLPTIRGTAQVGEMLSADTSGIEDTDGLTNVSYSYQWVANDGTSDTDIAGATGSTYTLADADEGRTITVWVSFTDDAGYDESLTSAATAAVEAKLNNPATGVPTISGTARVGETLAADTSGIEDADGLDNATFTHQWLADGSEIQGATEAGYVLTEAEAGKAVMVRVSFTDDGGNGESLTSAATGAVEAEPELQEPPARPTGLTGTVAHNEVSLTWDDPGDESITGYQILRLDRDVHGLGNFQVHVEDTGSAATSYVDRDVAPETRYVYRIKARNAAGLSVRSHYFGANTPPAPNTPATGAPAITGTARVGETLTADTSDIADADGLDNAVFSYQWIVSDGGADLDIPGATDATYTLIDIDAALRFMVRVSFTDDGGNEETLTSEATAVVAK